MTIGVPSISKSCPLHQPSRDGATADSFVRMPRRVPVGLMAGRGRRGLGLPGCGLIASRPSSSVFGGHGSIPVVAVDRPNQNSFDERNSIGFQEDFETIPRKRASVKLPSDPQPPPWARLTRPPGSPPHDRPAEVNEPASTKPLGYPGHPAIERMCDARGPRATAAGPATTAARSVHRPARRIGPVPPRRSGRRGECPDRRGRSARVCQESSSRTQSNRPVSQAHSATPTGSVIEECPRPVPRSAPSKPMAPPDRRLRRTLREHPDSPR